jgi:hypothetical protein
MLEILKGLGVFAFFLTCVGGIINVALQGEFIGRDNYTLISSKIYGDNSVLSVRQEGYREAYWVGAQGSAQYHEAYCPTKVLENLSIYGGYTLKSLTNLGVTFKEEVK